MPPSTRARQGVESLGFARWTADWRALIGSIAGGVLGMGVGAFDAPSEHGEELKGCMHGKGYALKAT